MKTQILFVAFVALATITSVLAAQPTSTAGSCTNFSGTWHGSCSTNGNVAADDMTITQANCQALNLGGLDLVVGGTTQNSKVSGDVTTTSVITTAWNKPRTQLYGNTSSS